MKLGTYTIGGYKVEITKETKRESLESLFDKHPTFKKAVLGNDNDNEISSTDSQSKPKRRKSKSDK